MGSWINFDDVETDIGTCFPIHVVVSVSLYENSSTQVKYCQVHEQILLICYMGY